MRGRCGDRQTVGRGGLSSPTAIPDVPAGARQRSLNPDSRQLSRTAGITKMLRYARFAISQNSSGRRNDVKQCPQYTGRHRNGNPRIPAPSHLPLRRCWLQKLHCQCVNRRRFLTVVPTRPRRCPPLQMMQGPCHSSRLPHIACLVGFRVNSLRRDDSTVLKTRGRLATGRLQRSLHPALQHFL